MPTESYTVLLNVASGLKIDFWVEKTKCLHTDYLNCGNSSVISPGKCGISSEVLN